ncbi:MAG: rod shape-determining protein RodA [Candidatus Babeliales bacterium]|nr:rod shape-determining protein RodA [Candidatus Babeliales bacterium]
MIKRNLAYLDWISLLLITVISAIGICAVFSATYNPIHPYSMFFKKQLFGIASGFVIYFTFMIIDYRKLCRIGYFIYFAVMVILIFTLIMGHVGLGAKRWINLGLIKFQPSELVKLFFPAYFAYYLETEYQKSNYKPEHLITLVFILLFTALLVLKQPDLGTALIILFCGTLLLWLSGLKRKYFIYTFVVGMICAPILWGFLRDYQKKRITVFLGQGDMQKERYQIEQSKIAIGSGGILGKGFLQGTQNKLEFLPEGRTDFIFSVLCEEFGFCGALFLLLLYLSLFLRLFVKILQMNDFIAKILATGLLSSIIFSTIVNISMVTGLLPIVGIPLPLISYGISHLWITFASLGWINGIIMRN